MLDRDLGHLCFGGRVQISGHSDFGILNNDGAPSIFTWEKADTASAACPAHPGSLDTMSMTFAAVICDADDPCSVNTAEDPESSFTMSPRSTIRPLHFWCFVSNSDSPNDKCPSVRQNELLCPSSLLHQSPLICF